MFSIPYLPTMDLIELLKLLKVCYSWWVLSSLIMIDRVHWIDKEKLTKFILNCQVTIYQSQLALWITTFPQPQLSTPNTF
jgi:hypothetical protein